MEKVNITGFTVNGIAVRTKNADEMDEKTAKIGKLWQEFFGTMSAQEKMPEVAYGVYSNYESDWQGAYDVTAATEDRVINENSVTVSVPAGGYLCFKKEGEMPIAALELWQEIWQFFSSTDAPVRAYTFDFEKYIGHDSVEIYIGILEEV